jgi:DNA polymerase III alpha subunit
MQVDKFGKVILSEDEAFSALYSGKLDSISHIYLNNELAVEDFNRAIKINADSIDNLPNYKIEENIQSFDKTNRNNWFMPAEYLEFPMEKWLLEQCTTIEEKERVQEEIALFIQHGAFDVLFYLKYLVDTMRKNNIVWGVGRGSSVASYILYLLGIHKINSIKYNLDIKEFLK